MKAEVELCTALKELLDELPYGIPIKERLATQVANLLAVLQVFTEHNFTPKEQTQLFDTAARRLKELGEKIK